MDEGRGGSTGKGRGVSEKVLSVIKTIDASGKDLNVRLARLEEHADSVEAFMAERQKNVLQENEQIAARLRKLEQKLTALTDQVSLIEHTNDAASLRDQERNNSIELRLTSA